MYPTLDRLALVKDQTTCFALRRKNGFIFSKEELSYWRTCQPSSLHQKVQKLRQEKRQSVTKGMASQNSWAWRPTENGHCVPQKKGMASHNNWAWRPTEKWHGVPASILQFGESIVRTFFPHRCDKEMESQAKAAIDWISATTE